MPNKIFIPLTILILVIGGVRFFTKYNEEVIVKNDHTPNYSNLKATLYSKEGCSYCIMAKDLLTRKHIKFESIEVGNNQDLFQKLANQTGQQTVPFIFIDGKFIGGYQDLKALTDLEQ